MRTHLWRDPCAFAVWCCSSARALERAEAALRMSVAVLQGRFDRVGDSCGHASRGVASLCKGGF